MSLLGWVAGCAAIWSGMFLIGSMLYGRWTQAAVLAVVMLVSGATLFWAMNHLWADMSSDTSAG